MKHLIYILFFLVFCKESDTFLPVNEDVDFQIYAGSKYIEDERIVVKNKLYVIGDGFLPMSLRCVYGELLVAEFEAKVSNFSSNHPQCDCELIAYNHYKCTEEFIVNGEDWELAK